ncbi:S1 family peptidase [Ancylobacter sp. SL191]|uniref:S1 family peptidase n=1 Tax=Ancylobacter sp. SL191 TaxID=2995166 RepID=UPI00227183B1|nr:trypsin-like serine protease [Ancylobacter sp. SL191]WAC27882.1 trypsin-like serine protease [Ancylobacter sp. SL191]
MHFSKCVIGIALAAAAVMGHFTPAFAFEMIEPEDKPASVQVIGGQPASNSEWPATLYFTTPDGACTSTVVGPRAVITAAHCVDDGQTGTIRLNGRTAGVRCEHHPGYAANHQLDVAMCLAAEDLTLPNGARFERLNNDPQQPAIRSGVVLLGYGCRRVGGGGATGSLYVGDTTVDNFSADYIVTKGVAALCFGDSGGSAYLKTSLRRRIIGINSRGDISETSYLTNVASPSVISFVGDWSKGKNAPVCGVGAQAGICRD